MYYDGEWIKLLNWPFNCLLNEAVTSNGFEDHGFTDDGSQNMKIIKGINHHLYIKKLIATKF